MTTRRAAARLMAGGFALLSFFSLAGLSRTARATPSARLVYSRAPSASSCPDETSLRKAVAARIGYDPFFGWAKKTVVVRMIPADGPGYVASVDLVDEQGYEHGARQIRTEGKCAELRDPVAPAIAIALDHRSSRAERPRRLSGYNPESKNVPFVTASFVVVDASATLGAGTFQMRITGADGSIEQAQILVYSNPDRIKLVLDNQSATLVRPVSLQYRAGICSPAFSGGTALPQAAFIPGSVAPGRWIWCGGEGYPAYGYGFDARSDGTAVQLDIDSTGAFVLGGPFAPDAGIYMAPYNLEGAVASVATCPAELGFVNSATNFGPGGFYQPIPPQ